MKNGGHASNAHRRFKMGPHLPSNRAGNKNMLIRFNLWKSAATSFRSKWIPFFWIASSNGSLCSLLNSPTNNNRPVRWNVTQELRSIRFLLHLTIFWAEAIKNWPFKWASKHKHEAISREQGGISDLWRKKQRKRPLNMLLHIVWFI